MTIKRIVSLTPSITEVLFALGAGDRLVAVTDACDYPPEANTKSHVCSWFDPDIDRIANLKPDIVIGLETAHHGLAPLLKNQRNPPYTVQPCYCSRNVGRHDIYGLFT